MIDIDGIGESLRLLIENNVTDFKMVRYEGDERDENMVNMPYCDIQINKITPEIRAGSEYVVNATYLVTVIALDLSSHREAATIRNGLVKLSMNTIKANPRFDTDLETTTLGVAEFVSAKDEASNAFLALATFEVDVLVFVNPL